MAKNKERLLFLLKSLMNTSDGASDYTLKELEELYENNGLSATQKTIRNDISKLIEAGFETEEYSEPGKPTHYSCRLTFEKPELKMIIDAVMAANFISASKCQQLVEKLMSLAGENAKDVSSFRFRFLRIPVLLQRRGSIPPWFGIYIVLPETYIKLLFGFSFHIIWTGFVSFSSNCTLYSSFSLRLPSPPHYFGRPFPVPPLQTSPLI